MEFEEIKRYLARRATRFIKIGIERKIEGQVYEKYARTSFTIFIEQTI